MEKGGKKRKERKVVAVIPAYNEEKYIGKVVRETKKFVDEVIVVDDGSSDKTGELARREGARVLRHEVNLQKGASLKTGCEFALKLKADIIIMMDADGQHSPSEIPKLIEKLDKYDLVIGARKFSKMPLKSRIGNKILSAFQRVIFKNKISDSQSGFRAFKSEIYPKIKWESSDYRVESEILSKLDKHNLKYGEEKIKTIYNDKYKGTTPLDGFKIALNTIKWRYA